MERKPSTTTNQPHVTLDSSRLRGAFDVDVDLDDELDDESLVALTSTLPPAGG